MTDRTAQLEALVVAIQAWLKDPSHVTFQPVVKILRTLDAVK